MVLEDIKPSDINEWLIWLDNRCALAYKTKTKIKGFLSRYFLFCVYNGYTLSDPCSRAVKLRKTEAPKEMLIWDENEFSAFISAVDDILYKTLFSFLYLTGCRRGETLALTWKDIAGNMAHVNKTLSFQSIKGGYNITTPKNQYSIRKIIIPENLIALLAELKAHYKRYELFSEDNFVFGGVRPLPQNNVRRKLAHYCTKASVTLIRVHDFRHSHASLLINRGHDIVTIARRLGHADIKMTLNQYAHLMPNKQNELMSTLNINL